MIPNPFKSFLLLYHQCPERCLLLLPSSQSTPPHFHPLPSSRKAQIPLPPLPLLISSLQDVEPTLLLGHRCLCHLSSTLLASILPFPLSCIKIVGWRRTPGSLSSIQPSPGGKSGWTEATEAQLFQGGEEAPCPGLLSGATHCPSHQ